jgi:hypothetical protein
MGDTRELFDRYAVALSTSNIDELTKCYNSSFIMSSAFGTQSVDNDVKFRSNLEHASGFYKQIGMESMNIAKYKESILDASHTLVQIEWFMRRKDTRTSVHFDVTYVVSKDLILFFIAHNEQERLKEAGLIFSS